MILDREVVVRVYGDPAPKGSLKCVGRRGNRAHVLVEDSARSLPWRRRVRRAGEALGLERLEGALTVEATLTVPRPAAHYGTGANAHTLRPGAPAYPYRRATGGHGGDVDKLARLVLDALEDVGVLTDDAQVVELTARKTYADGPGVLPDALDRPGLRLRLAPLTDGVGGLW